MMKTSVTAIAFAAIAGTAYAGNVAPAPVEPVIVAPVAPVAAWEGGYIGGQIGYAYSNFDLGDVNIGDFDTDSVIGGINAGYLWSVGNGWYLGPEFQYDWADLAVSNGGETATFDSIARLKLIVGHEIGTNGLLYGSAGVAYADFGGSVSDVTNTFLDTFDSDTSYVFGIGYDYRVSENWAIGGEYLYHKFNGVTSSGGDVDLSAIELKATYRF